MANTSSIPASPVQLSATACTIPSSTASSTPGSEGHGRLPDAVPPPLRLVHGGRAAVRAARARPRARRAVPVELRRRRVLFGALGLLLVVLALPLGGTGGRSHATGSALTGGQGRVVYTVRPGDTLWSIASRAEPGSDPRPLVAALAARTGSDLAVPGEQLLVP